MRALALLVAVGCSEVGLNDSSKGPELSFVQPIDGGRFDPTEPVSVCAALDYDGAVETLDVILVSDVGGTLATSGFTSCDGGELGIDVPLTDEPHVISMTATDVQGRSSTAIASITPSANAAPSCSVITPINGTALPIGTEVTMTVRVDNDEGPVDVAVDSNVDGAVANDTVATSGNAQFAFGLTPGPHDLVVTVTDTRDVAAACGVSIALVECEDLDNDGFENCDGDCNDNDPSIFPGAQETPDGVDNDCDGDVDEGTGNFDDDGDGFSELDGDCDDTDAQIFPGQNEIPDDGIDQDCDGNDAITCFEDFDDDGYGSSNTVVALDGLCDDVGEAPVDGDCDDADPTLNPGAPDIPGDGIDQDCDGTDPSGCFEDSDGDGFGSATVLPPGDGDCDDPGESNFSNDCDDTNPTLYPGATEILDDGIDQDCSGADLVTCYDDLDLDGYAGDTVVPEEGSCTQGSATVEDCDDTDNTINPGVTDTPDNGIDEDCSGSDAVRCFVDADMDTYGSGAVVVAADGACNTLQMESDNDNDCDDGDATVFPGAPEISGDGIDQNCSGSDSNDCFEDADGDGWGTNTTVASADADCDDPGEAGQSGDCRDGNPAVNPGATEIPDNAVDEDCSGAAAVSCFVDNDMDTFGSNVVVIAQDGSCDTPESESPVDGDCDDNDPNEFPGNPETPDDGIDQDCSGVDAVTCWQDIDRDEFGRNVTVVAADGSCDTADQEATVRGDCADNDPNRFPGNPEIPDNGIDEDCSGNDRVTCYFDGDQDGYGISTVVMANDGICNTAQNEAPVDGDCDDTNPNVYPGAPEVLGDLIDQDCDSDFEVLCYDDTDQDGLGAGAQYEDTDGTCLTSDGQSDVDGDCAPTDPAEPGADGMCGGACGAQVVNVGDILITEIMAQPDTSSNEWFEIYNATASDISLCGDWEFQDRGSDSFSVDDVSLVIPANGYFVLGAGAGPVDFVYTRSNFPLGNTGDEVQVWFEGVMIDEVAYPSVWEIDEQSRQLDPFSFDHISNDAAADESVWCLGTTTYPGGAANLGTPGEPNLSCP